MCCHGVVPAGEEGEEERRWDVRIEISASLLRLVCIGGEALRGAHGDGGYAAGAAVQQGVDDLHDVGLQGAVAAFAAVRLPLT